MTKSGIECFLAICRHGTGVAAAEALFITQSSLSIRLKTLERELGGALFYRKNGSREMVLTEAGKRFYGLALQYEALTEKMSRVCTEKSPTLRVASINSLGVFFLPEVYDRFLEQYPEVPLEIQDKELAQATEGLLSGQTDLAFTVGKVNDERLCQIGVKTEKILLVAGEKLPISAAGHPKDLKSFREIYVEWTHSFGDWHSRTFSPDTPPLTVSIMSQLQRYLADGDAFAFVPETVANGLLQSCSLRVVPTDFPIPTREISALTPKDSPHPAAALFLDCLR